ncbi:MAG: hypothetical protein ABJZ55_05980 [Fuerstiella sp.]
MTELAFNIGRYKQFISCFRLAVGVGRALTAADDQVVVTNGGTAFRYSVGDLYLNAIRRGTDDFRKLDRDNYSQMGISDTLKITGAKIKAAFQSTNPAGAEIAMIILATSEAARSQVVYTAIQRLLRDYSAVIEWREFTPILIGSWIFNIKENHKRRPIRYGALRNRDYYNKKAQDAISGLIKKTYIVD